MLFKKINKYVKQYAGNPKKIETRIKSLNFKIKWAMEFQIKFKIREEKKLH